MTEAEQRNKALVFMAFDTLFNKQGLRFRATILVT